jgi:hypothetical protein
MGRFSLVAQGRDCDPCCGAMQWDAVGGECLLAAWHHALAGPIIQQES